MPALTPDRFSAFVADLLGHLARHGNARRVPGPLLCLIWNHLRTLERRVLALVARIEAGRVRRHPDRRPPTPSATPRRRPSPGLLPRGRCWLVRLVPETARCAPWLHRFLADPDIAALLDDVPQLRRALQPFATMLEVRLPPATPKPARPDPPPSAAPMRAGPLLPPLPPLVQDFAKPA